MKMTTAETARENYSFNLKRLLASAQNDTANDDDYYDIAFRYRVLGILSLLMEADQQAYVDNLCKSGFARLFFLRDFIKQNQVDPIYLCSSKDVSFSASVAAGHLDLAKEISRYSSDHHNADFEYEDDFLFKHLQQQMVLENLPDDKLKELLDRWELVLEGATSLKLNVCKALVEKSADDFETAFELLLIKRKESMIKWKTSATFDEELYAAEGYLYLDGICLLRIAGMRGLTTKDEYPLIPRLAVNLGNVTFPSEDSWRSL